MQRFCYLILGFFMLQCTTNKEAIPLVPQWTTYEIELQSGQSFDNPYTDVDVWVEFENDQGNKLKRPAFWDGDLVWKVRVAPPDTGQVWNWRSFSSQPIEGLSDQSGAFRSVAYQGNNKLLEHGLLEMSPGKRNVVHKDGKSFLVVADTPWAIPFRATKQQVSMYAGDRQNKGFNAALLMTVQPDTKAEGPNKRNTDLGFARGFDDLSEAHINRLNPTYFQYLDSLIAILLDHQIVPVYQPVFHGFGWKGLDVLGNIIEPDEYVRYCKYLLARYGSQPAFWLIAGDNGGNDPGVKEAGEMLEEWDAYQQPTGLHYNPCDDYLADWAKDNPLKHCEHYNRMHQEEEWLDFQWAQTGHNGEHDYSQVNRMYDAQPTKANLNGEPTYEGMNDGKNGLGWWQGEEAWMQLVNGGTMGVVYGAASLWQWKVSADEEGWTAWAAQNKSWKEAMEMIGSTYVGLMSSILADLDLTDIEKKWDLTEQQVPLLAKEGEVYLSYLNEGGMITIPSLPQGLNYRWVDPKTGNKSDGGEITEGQTSFEAPDQNPWVLIIKKGT